MSTESTNASARTRVIRSLKPVAGLVLVGALCAGCDTYQAPSLEVTSVEAAERTDEGVSMVFVLAARNGNNEPLPLRDAEYTLDIEGERVFSGTRSAEATLRQSGVQEIRLPAVVNLDRDPRLADVVASGQARYRLAGTLRYVTPGQIAEILFDTGVRVPSVEFASEGRLDISAARTLKPGVAIPLPDTAPPAEPPQ